MYFNFHDIFLICMVALSSAVSCAQPLQGLTGALAVVAFVVGADSISKNFCLCWKVRHRLWHLQIENNDSSLILHWKCHFCIGSSLIFPNSLILRMLFFIFGLFMLIFPQMH